LKYICFIQTLMIKTKIKSFVFSAMNSIYITSYILYKNRYTKTFNGFVRLRTKIGFVN